MLKFAILLTFLGLALGFPRKAPRLGGRIVGGDDTTIAEHPYQLALLYYDFFFCGAAIIASLYALTTAQCVQDGVIDGLAVRAGSTTKSSGGQVINVEYIFIHPQYITDSHYNDIAVLLLELSITAPNAAIAPLTGADGDIREGQTAIITGWGTLEEDGITPEILQVLELPIISQQMCQTVYGSVLDNTMFCAGYWQVAGKDACQGDSGGPVMIGGVLSGLISWGIGCASATYPGVYTRIPSFRHWINEVTGL